MRDPGGGPGEVDEVTIYSRALLDSEIQAIALAGPAGKCRAPRADAEAPVRRGGELEAPPPSAT